MTDEFLTSVGIDIGTSTMQIIFSRLHIRDVSGYGMVPKIEIMDKKIIYESDIYFTPLISEDEIDGVEVKKILLKEYEKAKMKREDVDTGAVIITGETSRKKNANDVVTILAEISGDFVVASAGPNLESVLAGKGSGAAKISLDMQQIVANIDIGGGTSNICYFKNGEVFDTACYNIGGRLIKIKQQQITYISEKIVPIIQGLEMTLKVGDDVSAGGEGYDKIVRICDKMAQLLTQSVHLSSEEPLLEKMVTNKMIMVLNKPDMVILSGGVAECIKNQPKDIFAYGDIGVLLSESIVKLNTFPDKQKFQTLETMRATVIGAGNFSMEVSGSTIEYHDCQFPMKNIPVVRIAMPEHMEIMGVHLKQLLAKRKQSPYAIAMEGLDYPKFAQIEQLAEQIVYGLEGYLKEDNPVILVLEKDIGKVLGQALRRRIGKEKVLLCVDNIYCTDGDYIDIGEPLGSGKAVPVIVKTLIFNS